ncbi:MAG: TIGR03089 family protein [Mycobacteriaceae bacterium]
MMKNSPTGPRITFYDDATDERIELSTLTLMNWAAKTANLISEEFDITSDSKVCVLLPAHWQSAAVLLGLWWSGAEVLLHPTTCDLALTTMNNYDRCNGAADVLLLSLDPFGHPVPELPPGATDYATSVRIHGDSFSPLNAGEYALEGHTASAVFSAAQQSALDQGFSVGDRVLSTAPWDDYQSLLKSFISILATGASLVQVAHEDDSKRAQKLKTEKITHIVS